MKISITGAGESIGRNLTIRLKIENVTVFYFDCVLEKEELPIYVTGPCSKAL